MSFSLNCSRCSTPLVMNDFAIDKTCQNKHVFYFECSECGDFSATAMANIPQQQWPEFIAADRLDEVLIEYNAATAKK
ncbi:MAG: hypothetical protein QM479_12970 [Pseudomonadota bacterium]